MSFVHLHSHTHFSLLDGAVKIPDVVAKAADLKMPALAITDHGNMFGAIEFYKACRRVGIKPILGMEAYITSGRLSDRDKNLGKRDSAHLILLAKNLVGLKNLFMLSSIAYLDGFYRRPRIDHPLLETHSSGLIATSACLNGEIAQAVRNNDIQQAKADAEWYLQTFGSDFYLEIQDHGIPGEREVYDRIYKLGKEMGIPAVASNDNHYLDRDHWDSHDALICLQTGKDLDDPKRLRYNTTELYLKDADEMYQLFRDEKDALDNTLEIAEKVDLEIPFGELQLPAFPLPDEDSDKGVGHYLQSLAHTSLGERYDEVTDTLRQRLDHELQVIDKMGFAGYFLIVRDFIAAARTKGIPVGLGRGSAAGSLVAYVLGITAVDPIEYNLLFERFLNPERVSMPDIDIDFCYERRDEVIEYVRQKYGKNNVAQIITFGTLASRNALKDVARILKINFDEANKLSQLIPVNQGRPLNLKDAFDKVPELRALKRSANPIYQKLVKHAMVLEGIARQPGIHAAGVIIAPDDVKKFVPLYKNSDGDVTTQFSMNYLEDMGLLKMDFLGLRTLTVIDKTVTMIRERYGQELDPMHFPLDDDETYALFGKGQTTGVFQFESSGMKDHLVKLRPSRIQDLVAMNALYRPGPMGFIDNYIKRKHGEEQVEYLHPMLEAILAETYGIIVYQEQVMQTAHELAGFSLGQADIMRRAMGKKKVEVMAEMRTAFIEGCGKKDIQPRLAKQIFDSIAEFAKYGFNKSHAVAYALIAYQTAYLKAHFPAEFMAAVMTSEINQTDRIQLYMDEARHMGLEILPPDINHSQAEFVALARQKIAFGLEAIKNVGSKPIANIVAEREAGGDFSTLFDLVERVDLRLVNRKVLESLVQSGAADSLSGSRSQKFAAIDVALEFGNKIQQERGDKDQTSIFSAGDEERELIHYPELPAIPPWKKNEMLKREFQLLGFYLTGHPLEDFRETISAYTNINSASKAEIQLNQVVRCAGLIIASKSHITQAKQKEMLFLTLEDFHGSMEVTVFNELLEKKRELLQNGQTVMIVGRLRDNDLRLKIIAEDVFPLSEAASRLSGGIRLQLHSQSFESNMLRQIENLLATNHTASGVPVYLTFNTETERVDMLVEKYRLTPDARILKQLEMSVGKDNLSLVRSR
jgi:DNA polymerase-3 subunit alpha